MEFVLLNGYIFKIKAQFNGIFKFIGTVSGFIAIGYIS